MSDGDTTEMSVMTEVSDLEDILENNLFFAGSVPVFGCGKAARLWPWPAADVKDETRSICQARQQNCSMRGCRMKARLLLHLIIPTAAVM